MYLDFLIHVIIDHNFLLLYLINQYYDDFQTSLNQVELYVIDIMQIDHYVMNEWCVPWVDRYFPEMKNLYMKYLTNKQKNVCIDFRTIIPFSCFLFIDHFNDCFFIMCRY